MTRIGGRVAFTIVVQTDLVIFPTELDRALKPLVSVMAFSWDGELTHDFTVLYRMPRPMSTIITWIPARFAARNSELGLSLGFPSVSMSNTLGTRRRLLLSVARALRTAGDI